MSNDELLSDSLRALQKSTDGSSAHAARTRTQILARAAAHSRQRRRVTFVVMPLAAALMVSTAWAAVTGRLPRWIDMATGQPGPSGTGLGPPPEPRGVPSADPRAVLPASAADRDPDTSLPIIEPSNGTTKAAPTSTSSTTPTSIAVVSAKAPTASTREESLYAAAHQAHFVDRDPTTALRAWDAYLAAHPDGRFAIEARYNRAISLVRLGRRDEAREALASFAEGRYGAYRRSEARALLDALTATDSGTQLP